MIATLVLAAALDGIVLLHRTSGEEVPAASAVIDLRENGEVIATVVTAENGTFSLPLERYGFHQVSIRWNAFSSGGLIDVRENEGYRKFYVLEPTCWAAYGRVRDALTGRPIAGALVSHVDQAHTDAGGYYFIDWGCTTATFHLHNSYFYGVQAPGYRGFSRFGGRAESIPGPTIADYSLAPIGGVTSSERIDPEPR